MSLEQPDTSSPSPPACLRDHAIAYLARFPATKVKLRKVLVRWSARRSLKIDEQQMAVLMETLQASGYLDDGKFALGRARSLLQRGASLLDIRARLAKDGIEREQIQETLETLTENEDKEELEILAAFRVAQKKRLGPFRDSKRNSQRYSFGSPASADRGQQEKNKKKDIATLARKGFGWGIVQKIMQASDEDLCEWEKKLQEQGR